jgi:hypothetical protein
MDILEFVDAVYIGETDVTERPFRSKLTNSKIYRVKQYENSKDPVYGNTFVVESDDNGLSVIIPKYEFKIL